MTGPTAYAADVAPLFEDVACRKFYSDHYEQSPLLGSAAFDLPVSLNEIFEILPTAHSDGNVRYINSDTVEQGFDPKLVLSELSQIEASSAADAYSKYFQGGSVSFAVQRFEDYFPAIQGAADCIRASTGRCVSVTAFISPPQSAATKIHYDKSDVFALQMLGEKQWEVFHPVDRLPSHRTPNVPFDAHTLCDFATYQVSSGQMLYLPRGWIHRVSNLKNQASVHLSFVVFSDSWTSLFGNLMDAAYARLRATSEWRGAVSPGQLDFKQASQQITKMSEELARTMVDLMGSQPSTFLDHCLNGADQRHVINQARQSLHDAESERDYFLEPSGAHHLVRHGEVSSAMRVSVDGRQFFEVESSLLEAMNARPRLSVLETSELWSSSHLLSSIDVLVHKLGIYKLVPCGTDTGGI